MVEKFDVLVVGDATMDFIFTDLPHLPRMGEDTLAGGFDLVPGEAYNTTVALHRLGVKTAWAADFGNDALSKMVLDFARQEGMNQSFFVHHNRSFRRLSVAASMPDERGFLSFYDPEPTIQAAIPALTHINARVLFIPGLFFGAAFDAALPLVRLKKMKILMDGNTSDPISITDKRLVNVLRNLEVFLPNKREILSLAKTDNLQDAMKRVAEYCPLVVVKAGDEGSYAYDRYQFYHQPAISIKVVDTTGAGDCFNAGFLKAWLDEKPLETCLQWGNVVAGLSTQGFGAAGYKVTIDRVNEELRKSNSRIS